MHRSALALICLTCVVTTAGATVYTGSLSYTPPLDGADGLVGLGSTWDGPMTLSWVVTDEESHPAGFPWKYAYTLVTPGPGASPSHAIIEVSSNFTTADFTSVSGSTEQEVADFQPGGGNPDMPGAIHGLKFDGLDESSTLVLSFFCSRLPVWGDFYSKDGKVGGLDNTMHNAGFTVADPTDPPASGSVDGLHLLVPDTVPEPTTLLVVGGLTAAGLARRRKAR